MVVGLFRIWLPLKGAVNLLLVWDADGSSRHCFTYNVEYLYQVFGRKLMRVLYYILVVLSLAGMLMLGSCCGDDDDVVIPAGAASE